MATDPYSVFVCYRWERKEFADKVVKTLTAAGCRPRTDADFPTTTDSHWLQSAAEIEGSSCVVVVMPPEFDWLPQNPKELLAKFGGEHTPQLGNEIKWVYQRLVQNSKQPVIVLLEQTQENGRWQPTLKALPTFLGNLPVVIECGGNNWQEELTDKLRSVKTLEHSQYAHDDVLEAVDHVFKEAFHGRASSQVVLAKAPSAEQVFTYHATSYIDLRGKKTSLGCPGATPSRGNRVAEIEPTLDLVTWILEGECQDGWLVGGVGSGKTVALTRGAYLAASKWLEWTRDRASKATSMTEVPPMPILLTCASFYPRDSDERKRLNAGDLVEAMCRAVDTRTESFKTMLRTRKCLLLIDGLDDVEDHAAAERIVEAILLLRKGALGFKAVVTTRLSAPSETHSPDVVTIQPLSSALREELVNKIAQRTPRFQFRVKQVLRVIRDAATRPSEGEDVYGSPLGLTIACRLARETTLPIQARFGELLEHMIRMASARSEHPEVWRDVLRALALERMKNNAGIPIERARQVVGRAADRKRAFVARELSFETLAGILKVYVGSTEDTVEFEQLPFRYFLAAEAVASWPLSTIVNEFPGGWKDVVRYVPGILARQGRVEQAVALIDALADAAEDHEGSDQIWLKGLEALVDHSAIQDSEQGRKFIVRAKRAADGADGWNLQSRAKVIDACGLAARSVLREVFRPTWVPVAEIIRPGKRFHIASAPVLVSDYAKFLDDAGKDSPEYWKETVPRFILDTDEWYEQLRFPLRPVTGVTWHEARAYCRWLACQPGLEGSVVRLPTRSEWKTIARPRGQAHEYPWGEGEGEGQFNGRTSGLNHPSPVGLFPAYCRDGLFDIGTNVYEWSGEGITDQGDVEVLGGTWKAFLPELRIDRSPIYCGIDLRRPDTGFRCVLERAELVAGERR